MTTPSFIDGMTACRRFPEYDRVGFESARSRASKRVRSLTAKCATQLSYLTQLAGRNAFLLEAMAKSDPEQWLDMQLDAILKEQDATRQEMGQTCLCGKPLAEAIAESLK